LAVLLLAGLTMIRIAWSESSLQALQTDAQRRGLIRFEPPPGAICRDCLPVVHRRCPRAARQRGGSPVLQGLSGSGLLFLAMLFMGAGNATSVLTMLAGPNPNADLFAYGRSNAQTLISVYAMRMAAVFTLSVSTVGLRTSGLRSVSTSAIWSDSAAGWWGAQVVPALVPHMGPLGQRCNSFHPPP
jgi:hypothetical protein